MRDTSLAFSQYNPVYILTLLKHFLIHRRRMFEYLLIAVGNLETLSLWEREQLL